MSNIITKIDKKTLKKMFEYGSLMIESEYEYINELNVFPVPDGDTGTNMKITTTNAFAEISNKEFKSIYELAKSFSRSLLMNARGNSGVILSQIIKGFVSGFKPEQNSIGIMDLKIAFSNAKKIAYESVSNPVEGTILTVIRMVSEELLNYDFNNINDLISFVYIEAKKALDLTPSLLPQLKNVGVVDSGGYGLVKFIEGMKRAIFNDDLPKKSVKNLSNDENNNLTKSLMGHFDNETGFGYCSEIILKIGAKIEPSDSDKKIFDTKKFKKELLKFGDSLVLVADEDILKVHIHTKNPQKLLDLGQKYGEFIKIKIENMTEQFYERLSKEDGIELLDDNKFIKENASKKLSNKIELIHTVSCKKTANIFKEEYGFKNILVTTKGNPSIQEIIEIVDKVSSSKIIFFTDDTNVVLAAKQAAATLKSKIDMRIIPCSNIAESLISSLEFDPVADLDTNEKKINKALKEATTGLISRSVKDVSYSHIKINKSDYIGIINKKILFSSQSEFECMCSLLDSLVKKVKNPDVAIIFKGENANNNVIEQLEEYLLLKYEIVCDIKESSQSIYNYIIAIQ